MKGIILAGGLGKRLGGLTKVMPKPMVRIAGKPVLEHQIDFFKRNGITDIYVLTGYLGHVIEDYFGDGAAFGVNITYSPEDRPLGTAGCLKPLEGNLKEDFVLLYGDVMLDVKLGDFMEFHRARSSAATLAIHPNDHPFDSDIVTVDDNGRITGFIRKDAKPRYYENLVNAGVYILSPEVLRHIDACAASDFVKDIFPKMLNGARGIYGYRTAEYMKDMGTPERLAKVEKDFLGGKIRRSSREYKRPCIFLDRDGTLVEHLDQLHRVEDLELLEPASRAVKAVNRSLFLACIVTNQPAVARNLCDVQTVKAINNKLLTLLGEDGAYIDAVYFCPHHPDRGYPEENPEYKIDCGCRKPKTGMIDLAASELNIDLAASWIIGDTTTDVQTGRNAGIKTALVRTGVGGRDGKYACEPDFVFDDVNEAVSFITSLEKGERH